ncbi:hypothetical protein BD324DRAFT_233779 [Kockovaella imperatae]|uniref:Transcription factor domain-containing protein n=1 Tax=Kockovaella imperatae TaxID=4999 RepID=A0A1Y1UQQ7_9TREE|nr:hypothetical protein BD324DRAFT_233779 [Kockovaella imperatae]ORX39776.1 hypothetical protein BD324DRAFT_233779 [Kockovaella imperatae]
MLSSAASAQGSGSVPQTSTVPGLRDGASENAMMSHSWAATPGGDGPHTGLTPFLSFSDNARAQPANEVERAERQATGSSAPESSRRSSSQGGSISIGTPAGPPPPGLSPSGVFNFSPAPSGPTASAPMGTQSQTQNWPAHWPPALNSDTIEPSQKTEGPWRGVDTINSVYPEAAQFNQTNTNADSTQPFFGDEALQQQLLLDLFWPGWPASLPEPHIVNDLVEAFFDLVPNIPRLLHRSRFLARLALPPTHPNFPHPAMIHAICASAASWCSPDIYQKSRILQTQTVMGEKPDPRASMSFALKQAAYGKEAVQDGLNTGNRLFDVVRAMIILCRVFIDDTR